MKAVILAAGKGTRIPKISETIPKAMIEINGVSIIERHIEMLEKSKINDIYVVIGFMKETLIKHIKQVSSEIRVIENNAYQSTNNMYSLYLAKDRLMNSNFILINGDTYFEESILKFFLNNSEQSVIPYDSTNFDPEELKLKIKDDCAYAIMPKNSDKSNSNGSTIGVFYLNKEDGRMFLDDIEAVLKSGQNNEWFEYSLDRVFKKTQMKPFDVAGKVWIEIDNGEDFRKAQSLSID